MLNFQGWIINEGLKNVSFVLANIPKKIFLRWIDENVKNEYLFENKGIEEETHVTVIANLETDNVELVKKVLNKTKEFEIKLGKVSMFTTNESFDVLKIDVISKELEEIHNLLKRKIPNTQTHKEFKPHCTLAYIKKQKHKELIGNSYFEDKKYKIKTLLFSDYNRTKTEINLKNDI